MNPPRIPRALRAAPALAAILALVLGVPGGLRGEDEGLGAGPKLSFSGYVKNFSIAYRLPKPVTSEGLPTEPLLGQSNTRLRLSLDYAPRDWLKLHLAYDFSPRIQDPFFFRASPFAASAETNSYRLVDFRNPLVPGEDDPVGSFGLYHNLDRFSATIKMKFGDLTLGRQPIAWGSAKVINPTDIIAPFSFYDLDKEERFGVDAARLRIPLSDLSELDLGYVVGHHFEFDRSAFFLRSKVHVLQTDVSLLLVGFQEDLLFGCDLARSIGGSGVWLEAAYVLPDALRSGVEPRPPAYARLSAGIDRSLSGSLYGFLEYHFNSAGAALPSGYAALFTQPAYTRGTDYLLGRHYLNLGANYQLSALVTVTGLVIWNVTDGSLAVAPQADYNISENIYLGGGVYLGLGRRPETSLFGGPAAPPVLRSEFGSYPDFAYVSFRVYF
jgi:hypothetical protein